MSLALAPLLSPPAPPVPSLYCCICHREDRADPHPRQSAISPILWAPLAPIWENLGARLSVIHGLSFFLRWVFNFNCAFY